MKRSVSTPPHLLLVVVVVSLWASIMIAPSNARSDGAYGCEGGVAVRVLLE